MLFSRRNLLLVQAASSCGAAADCSCDLITNVDQRKFLDLCLDSDLRFDRHVHKICSKMRTGVATLSRMPRNCSLEMKWSVFHAIVGSHVPSHAAVLRRRRRREELAFKSRCASKTSCQGLIVKPELAPTRRSGSCSPVKYQRRTRIIRLVCPSLATLLRPPQDRINRSSIAGTLLSTRNRLATTDGFSVFLHICI